MNKKNQGVNNAMPENVKAETKAQQNKASGSARQRKSSSASK